MLQPELSWLYFVPMTRSTPPRVRSLLVGLAFLFASVGRSVVDAALYHSEAGHLAGRVHVEAVDGNSCHAESCLLKALTAPLKIGSLGMHDLRVRAQLESEALNQPHTPPRSSHPLSRTQPRAPPTRV